MGRFPICVCLTYLGNARVSNRHEGLRNCWDRLHAKENCDCLSARRMGTSSTVRRRHHESPGAAWLAVEVGDHGVRPEVHLRSIGGRQGQPDRHLKRTRRMHAMQHSPHRRVAAGVMEAASVTSKAQGTIPKELRQQFDIRHGSHTGVQSCARGRRPMHRLRRLRVFRARR